MKKRLLLTFLSVLSIIPTIRGQEIGANFNESISEPLEQVNLLKKSEMMMISQKNMGNLDLFMDISGVIFLE